MNRSRENLPVTISADWLCQLYPLRSYLRVARRGSIIADVITLKPLETFDYRHTPIMTEELQHLLDHAEEAYQIPCRDDAGRLDLLARNSAGDTLVHAAVGQQYAESIRFLVLQGVDVNARGDFFETAYFQACRLGYAQIAAMLLELGADPDIVDHRGNSPAGINP